jgi:hypothetical protein
VYYIAGFRVVTQRSLPTQGWTLVSQGQKINFNKPVTVKVDSCKIICDTDLEFRDILKSKIDIALWLALSQRMFELFDGARVIVYYMIASGCIYSVFDGLCYLFYIVYVVLSNPIAGISFSTVLESVEIPILAQGTPGMTPIKAYNFRSPNEQVAKEESPTRLIMTSPDYPEQPSEPLAHRCISVPLPCERPVAPCQTSHHAPA